MISLDKVHQLLDRQLDDGAAFSQIRCHVVKSQRHFLWESGRISEWYEKQSERWVLRTLHSGAWGVIVAHSFDELQETLARSSHLAKEMARRINPSSIAVKEIMMSKPIRQLRKNPVENDFSQPTYEEVSLWLKQIEKEGFGLQNLNLKDEWVEFFYWDTEHSRGIKEYYNLSLKVLHMNQENGNGEGKRNFYHTHAAESQLDLQSLAILPDLKVWKESVGHESFRGPSLHEVPWVLSQRAFAQLIYYTLGATLCLERPDPFLEAMNPASLDEKKVSSECLNIIFNPTHFSSISSLDQEGVPLKRIQLIEKGVLKNFVLTRRSAFHLSRSLSIHKEKVLSGGGRASEDNQAIRPDIKYIEVPKGESLYSEKKEGHVYVTDLQVIKHIPARDMFYIQANDSYISKYNGLHKRTIKSIGLYITRDELWSKLEKVGDHQCKVSLCPDDKFQEHEEHSCFLVPEAKFKGFVCTWN